MLALYIDKGGVGKDYGEAVAGLIGLLVWVFYSSVALLLGAEITQRLSREGRRRTEATTAPFGGSASSAVPAAPSAPALGPAAAASPLDDSRAATHARDGISQDLHRQVE